MGVTLTPRAANADAVLTAFPPRRSEKAAQDCGFDFSGVVRPQNSHDHYSLNYQSFIMPMVKAMQEQQKEIVELKKMIKEQQKMIDQLIHK